MASEFADRGETPPFPAFQDLEGTGRAIGGDDPGAAGHGFHERVRETFEAGGQDEEIGALHEGKGVAGETRQVDVVAGETTVLDGALEAGPFLAVAENDQPARPPAPEHGEGLDERDIVLLDVKPARAQDDGTCPVPKPGMAGIFLRQSVDPIHVDGIADHGDAILRHSERA